MRGYGGMNKKYNTYRKPVQSSGNINPKEDCVTKKCPPIMDRPSVEMYDQSKKRIDTIFNYKNDMYRYISKRNVEQLHRTYTLVRRQMDTIAYENHRQLVSKDLVNAVNDSLILLTDIVLFKPLGDIMIDMAMELSRFFFNWNKFSNVKNGNINRRSMVVTRLIEHNLSMVDTMNLMRRVKAQFERTFDRRPPAFELSKHFDAILREDAKRND